MSFIVPMEKPKRCGLCPCFHAEHPMHCQAVKAHKDKRIIAPYGAPIPDWCPLIECRESLFSAENARKFLRENPPKERHDTERHIQTL